MWVAYIPDPVAIRVLLIGIRGIGAVVARVSYAVPVIIICTRTSYAVTIRVLLIGIAYDWTIVLLIFYPVIVPVLIASIAKSVLVQVFLCWIFCIRAIVITAIGLT